MGRSLASLLKERQAAGDTTISLRYTGTEWVVVDHNDRVDRFTNGKTTVERYTSSDGSIAQVVIPAALSPQIEPSRVVSKVKNAKKPAKVRDRGPAVCEHRIRLDSYCSQCRSS